MSASEVFSPAEDEAAFAEIYRAHHAKLLRYCQYRLRDRYEAEDVAQEAFARALTHWRRVRTGTNPAGYLFRTAFRLLRRRGLLPRSPLDDVATIVDDSVELRIDLERALTRLPARRRAVVIMVWLLDVSTADTADALSITPGTVRKQLELARTDLRRKLTR